MREELFLEIVRNAPIGYAYHKLLVDRNGKAEDYVFLDVNPAFEEMTGLKREAVIGKRVTEVLPGIRAESFDWVSCCGKVALDGEKRQFIQYLESLRRWYRVTAFSSMKGYFVTLFQEITEEMRKMEYEKAISSISRLALQERRMDVFLEKSLRLLGEITGVSRTYIFERDPQQGTMSNTFEWTAPGIAPQKDNLQKIPEEEHIWWVERLKNGDVISCRDIEEIPDEKTRDVLRQQDIKALLVLPLNVEGEYWGFIGFDDCASNREWAESDTGILQIAAEVISQYVLRKKQEEKLWQENQRFRAIVDSAADFIFELDAELRFRAVYGKLLEKQGVEAESFLGKNAREIFGQEEARVHEEAGKKALAGEAAVYEWKVGEGDKAAYYQISLSPIFDRVGNITGVVGIGRNVTDLIRLQQSLRKEKELLHTTLMSIGDGVVTTDMGGRITGLNRAAAEITGWQEEEVLGKPFEEVFRLLNEETGKPAENPVAKVLQSGRISGLVNHTALIARDGRMVPVADSAAPIIDESGIISGVVMVFRDITGEKEKQEKILYLSYHDQLTGLYNRRFMEEEIRRIDTPRQLPLAVIMGDLNGLKLTNDIFGHMAGDLLLQQAAEVLRMSCRREDVVARWGGDEFLIFLPKTGRKAAEEIIARIKEKCALYEGIPVNLSIALGYAVKTKADEDIWKVVRDAEEWMYRHKLLEGKSYRNVLISTLQATLFEKSMETEKHAERLKEYCLEMGRALKLSDKELDELSLLAVIHDIGKVAIRESILQKPCPLTEEEWEEMKRHPEIGYRIAQNTPELAAVAEYILYHHERWDGKGYPRGLKGEEIPLLSRILAVADAYDAMTTDRPYRKAVGSEQACREIEINAGTQFDPDLAKLFVELYRTKFKVKNASLAFDRDA